MKTGFTFLNHIIEFCADLYMDEDSVEFILKLIKMELKLFLEKSELQLDFKSGNKAMGCLFGTVILPLPVFHQFLITVLDNIDLTKKTCELMIQLLNSPVNYLKINDELGIKYVKKALDYEPNSALYKQLLTILSTFFRYRVDIFYKIKDTEQENKNRMALLLQAYLLAENARLDPQLVRDALKLSQKEKRIIWAR